VTQKFRFGAPDSVRAGVDIALPARSFADEDGVQVIVLLATVLGLVGLDVSVTVTMEPLMAIVAAIVLVAVT
jgi:hypothetical protein